MATRVDLGSYEASAQPFLDGNNSSTGWEILDALERMLWVELIPAASADEGRARALLAQLRTRLKRDDEIGLTTDRLARVTLEYKAALEALALNKTDRALWAAAAHKLLERRMYEARLKRP